MIIELEKKVLEKIGIDGIELTPSLNRRTAGMDYSRMPQCMNAPNLVAMSQPHTVCTIPW